MGIRSVKLTLAYDGTAYAGWQFQLGRPTVQEAIERAVRKVTGHDVRILASGRTDAGVHALSQVVRLRTRSRLPPDVLRRALNANLPPDIAILDVADVAPGFHPIRDVRQKHYRYLIHDGPVRDVFLRHYVWHYRFGRLNAEAMRRAAAALTGEHDFSSFETSGAPRKSSVRTVFNLQVSRLGAGGEDTKGLGIGDWGLEMANNSPFSRCVYATGYLGDASDLIAINISADGFLYNMVRSIVGTLVEVGRGAQPENWPGEVLRACNRRLAGPTAPPQGLFLVGVEY